MPKKRMVQFEAWIARGNEGDDVVDFFFEEPHKAMRGLDDDRLCWEGSESGDPGTSVCSFVARQFGFISFVRRGRRRKVRITLEVGYE